MTGDILEQALQRSRENEEEQEGTSEIDFTNLHCLSKYDHSFDLNTIIHSACSNSKELRQKDFNLYSNFSTYGACEIDSNFKLSKIDPTYFLYFSSMAKKLDIRLLGSANFDTNDLQADLVALTRNKFYGPYVSKSKGIHFAQRNKKGEQFGWVVSLTNDSNKMSVSVSIKRREIQIGKCYYTDHSEI